jgi:hypothetical protein
VLKDVTINGKRVTLWCGEYTAERFHAAFVGLTGYKRIGDFEIDIKPFVPFVELWELKGDPADWRAWAQLDYFKELTPLMLEIGLIWQENMADLEEATGENEEKNSD